MENHCLPATHFWRDQVFVLGMTALLVAVQLLGIPAHASEHSPDAQLVAQELWIAEVDVEEMDRFWATRVVPLDRFAGGVVVTDPIAAGKLVEAGFKVTGPLRIKPDETGMFLSKGPGHDHGKVAVAGATRILWENDSESLLATRLTPSELEANNPDGRRTIRTEPLRRLADAHWRKRTAPSLATTFAPLVDDMVAQVDTTTFMRWVRTLSGSNPAIVGGNPVTFATRYSRTSQCRLAEQYVFEQFSAMGYTDVQYDPFALGSTTARNVIATLPGTVTPENIVIIGGHLDSISPDLTSLAPGANDNASGTATVLILAEIMKNYQFNSTIRFIAFTGEEQGLDGSYHYAQEAAARGDSIVAVVIADMMGWYDQFYRLEIQGEPPWDWLMQIMNDACSTYTTLETNLNYESKRSDHVSFQNEGFAAFLAVEDEWKTYPHYHEVTDTADKVKPLFGVDVAKACLATAAHVANAVFENSSAPILNLASPSEGSSFLFGDPIVMVGNGGDPEDGVIPDSSLHWSVDLHYPGGTDPIIVDLVGGGGSFVPEDAGYDPGEIFYRVIFWAQDTSGLVGQTHVDLFADPSLLIETAPTITSTPAPVGAAGVPYIYQPLAAGDGPINWAIPVGPGWLVADTQSGLVTGTPPEVGTFEVHLQAHNSAGVDIQTWTVVIGEAGPVQTAIPLGTNWRYFKGSTDPGPDWMNLSYPDSTWLVGPSGFGYGDQDDATVLDDMRFNYSTVFTRHIFQVQDPAEIFSFALLADFDDGFAAYLNGSPLFARHAPTTITHTSNATGAHEANGNFDREEFTSPLMLDLLQAGDNILAVVGLNDGTASSDFTLKIQLEISGTIHTVPTDAPLDVPLLVKPVWPNPFHRRTNIQFSLSHAGVARLRVYDVSGHLVRSIVSPRLSPGAHILEWDGRDRIGNPVASGIYFYRVLSPNLDHRGKVVRILR